MSLRRRARRTWSRLRGRPIRGQSAPDRATVEFLATTECRSIAEIGVEWGSTSVEILGWLDGDGVLHLFDYEDRLSVVMDKLRRAGHSNFVAHENSRRTLDSYNWGLMKLLRDGPVPLFDYVYLDGAHTWGTDALASAWSIGC